MEAKVKKVLMLSLELPGVSMSTAGRTGAPNSSGGEPWQLERKHDYNAPAAGKREWWTLQVDQDNAKETADELAAAAKAIREAMCT